MAAFSLLGVFVFSFPSISRDYQLSFLSFLCLFTLYALTRPLPTFVSVVSVLLLSYSSAYLLSSVVSLRLSAVLVVLYSTSILLTSPYLPSASAPAFPFPLALVFLSVVVLVSCLLVSRLVLSSSLLLSSFVAPALLTLTVLLSYSISALGIVPALPPARPSSTLLLPVVACLAWFGVPL